jgi:hypothetical protein
MAQQVFKIADATKVKLITKGDRINLINSITIANIHSGDATVDLYLVSQVGTKITDTGTNSDESDNTATTSSVTLTVDGTAATADVFANEQVWKSDGTLFGTCTARNSDTEIVFGSGVSQTLAEDDDLYVGTRYYIFKSLVIPTGQTLKLESDEVSFDNKIYNLYVKLAGSTPVDIILKH